MSRITLSRTATAHDLATVAGDDAYADHCMVWAFFPGEGARRRFLFRRMEHRGRPSFLVVSPSEPVCPSPGWSIETKTYDPALRTDERLAFSLLANPVIRRRTEDGRQRRDDVVMDAKCRFKTQHPDRPVPVEELIQEAGVGWLATRGGRLGFGVDPDQVRCEGYRQHRVVRRGRRVAFSSLVLEGILRVTDPRRLRETLFTGIGPSKAFGCGLMLVRRG